MTRTENIRLRRVVKPTNKDKLVAGIYRFRDSGTAAECCKYISHLRYFYCSLTRRKSLVTASFDEKTAPLGATNFPKVLDYRVDGHKYRRIDVLSNCTRLRVLYKLELNVSCI